MNERIQELAAQAKASVPADIYGPTKWIEVYNEKFAELIVWECIEVCRSRVGNSDYNTGRMHCVSDLKDHFGVEE